MISTSINNNNDQTHAQDESTKHKHEIQFPLALYNWYEVVQYNTKP